MLRCDEGKVDMFTSLYNHTVGRQHAVAFSWTVLCGYHGKHKQSIPTTCLRGHAHCCLENQESEPSHRCEYHEGGFAKAGILLLYNDWVTLCLVLENSWSIIGVNYAVSSFTLLESYLLSPWFLHCEVGFYTG